MFKKKLNGRLTASMAVEHFQNIADKSGYMPSRKTDLLRFEYIDAVNKKIKKKSCNFVMK